jgi:UDP:flavonoid glycosyltransferase YjiC (YdhE family)
MSRIVVFASGTLGDHLPFVAVARALAGRGHRVTLAINRVMHPYAHAAGLDAVALTDVDRGPEQARDQAWAWNHWDQPGANPPSGTPSPDPGHFVTQALELAGLCRDADLLLSTSIRVQGCFAQRATGVPWLTLSVNPYTFGFATGEAAAAHREGSLAEYRLLRPTLAAAWRALGIRTPVPDWAPGWNYARHVLLGSSAHFCRHDPAQLQPRHSLETTGFWFWEDPAGARWQPDPELEAFCARRPIVLAFSSQPLEDPRPILARHVHAAAALGLPLLVQSGWAGFSAADLPAGCAGSDVRFADFLPQDWLFARASCAIQHGGIGSIARALRHGCPLLIEPFGNDQFYNADRVHRLGVGAAAHPFRSTADGTARLLEQRVLAPGTRRRAETLGARLRAERGVDRACDLIEAHLAAPRADELQVRWRVPGLGEWLRPALPRRGPTPGQRPDGQIPRVLHQVWMQGEPPADLAAGRSTWHERHPAWIHRLWTGEEIRRLIREHYPWFLPLYDGYADPAMHADAGRCFLLHRFGGVVCDPGLECLRPLDPLLAGERFVAVLEPEVHRLRLFRGGGGPRHLIANGLVGSTAGHPFWEHLFRELVRFSREPGSLDATGPLLLSRACASWPDRDGLRLLPAETLFPHPVEERWAELPGELRAVVRETALAVHTAGGDWWRATPARDDGTAAITLVERERTVSTGRSATDWLLGALAAVAEPPLVSCLMPTRGRAALARRAIELFCRQDYARRELVILDNGGDDALGQWVRARGDERVRYHFSPDDPRSLGELRNETVRLARGEYVAQWDDDDLSDPRRLRLQLATLLATGADACLLEREQLWLPAERRLLFSVRRPWESSLVAKRSLLPAFPDRALGSDTPVVDELLRRGRVALLDLPELYTYVFHGGNVRDREHWGRMLAVATASFDGPFYDGRVRELLRRLGLASPVPGNAC